jgi:hypothetical protein
MSLSHAEVLSVSGSNVPLIPRVVHEDVQLAEGVHRRLDGLLPFRLVADVELDEDGLAAGGLDLVRDLTTFCLQQIGDRHLGALAGEDERLALAHAVGGAADERDLPVESHGYFLPGSSNVLT